MFATRTWAVLIAALLLASVAAQPAPAEPEERPPAAQPAEAGPEEQPDAAGSDEEGTPALAAIGISAGFPSYQTIAPTLSLQSGHFGFQAKASWTPVGPYVGLQVRAYPPLPIPVPVFVGVGAGFYGRDISYHAALGAHVPLGLNARFDIEGGIASVPLLGGRGWAPHLAAGLSYAFPVETGAGEGIEGGVGALAPGCAEPTEPDESALEGALASTVREFIRSARATYGSVYRNLSYSYDVKSTTIDGDSATVVVEYSGSVTEIATGKRLSASGEASATFVWTGCAWSSTGVSY